MTCITAIGHKHEKVGNTHCFSLALQTGTHMHKQREDTTQTFQLPLFSSERQPGGLNIPADIQHVCRKVPSKQLSKQNVNQLSSQIVCPLCL